MGRYKIFSKSRFIEEIPPQLIEEEENSYQNSEYNNGWGGSKLSGNNYRGSSFKNAVSAKRETSISKSVDSIFIKKANGEAPSTNNLASSLKDAKKKTTVVVKKKASVPNLALPKEETKEPEKPKFKAPDFSAMKAKYSSRAELEKAEVKQQQKTNFDVSALINKCKEKAQNAPIKEKINGFSIGARVFHSTYGIGFIKEAKNTENDVTYTVEFTKHGLKTLDHKTANLKSF